MASEKPTILLAHGAWHPPHLYEPLKKALAEHGYTLVVPALPTMGVDATGIGWDADVKALLDHAEPYFAQGKEVVLVAHSYGGIPACVATRGNGVAERAEAGLPGGFRRVIFLCAFALPTAGLSNLTAIPGAQWLSWQRVIETEDVKQLFVNETSKEYMYNDLSPEMAQEFYEALVPQSYAATIQPVDFAVPDITIPKTYVVCEFDNALPAALQRQWISSLGFEKVSVNGSHTAFASIPDELATVLVNIAEPKS